MTRLFWKLFAAFWLTTIVILTVTIFVSFQVAKEESAESFVDPREVDAGLQAILQTAGIEGLRRYVGDADNFPPGQTVYLVNEDGKDLLERRLPQRVQNRARRIWSSINERGRDRRGSERTPRRLRQSLLEPADGEMLLAMPGPVRSSRFGFFSSGSGRWMVLALAAAISLFSFWLLSRSLTRPVARISEASAELAAGDMGARVGPGAYSNDEIGRLAVQFDRMANDLDAQSRMRREMFRNIAHELRAPLTRVQIATELLERKPDRLTENVERIRYEVARLESLASQVLSLARAEQVLDHDDVTALIDVTDQIAKDAEFEATSRKVRLRYDHPAESLDVRGNPDAIASASGERRPQRDSTHAGRRRGRPHNRGRVALHNNGDRHRAGCSRAVARENFRTVLSDRHQSRRCRNRPGHREACAAPGGRRHRSDKPAGWRTQDHDAPAARGWRVSTSIACAPPEPGATASPRILFTTQSARATRAPDPGQRASSLQLNRYLFDGAVVRIVLDLEIERFH